MEMLRDNAAKKTKRLTSVVWNHFERIKKADAQYAVCLHCKKKLSGSSNSGTTHLRNHLLRCLKRSNYDVSQILSAKRKRKDPIQGPLPTIPYGEGKMKDEVLSPIPLRFDQEHRREEINQNINLGSLKFDQGRSRVDLARMIMLHGYPLSMVDHVGFQTFVKNLQPMFEFKDCSNVEMDCLSIYVNQKQKVYGILDHLHARINVSVNIWVSAAGSDFICLVANYIDEDWRLHKKMLNFVAVDLSSIDVLSEVIINLMADWGVDGKLLSMTFDDCAAHELSVFKIKDLVAQNKHMLKGVELFDIRCVTQLLKSIAVEVMEGSEEIIKKARDTVRHVKSSRAFLSKLKDIAEQVGIDSSKCLVHDVPVRWDSTYMMLQAATEYKGAFSFLKEHDSSFSNALSETEWEQVSVVVGYIKLLFDSINTLMEHKHPTANIFFSEICDIQLQLIEWSKGPDDFLSCMALKMKYKFDVYWNKCNLVLAIAAVLDPRFKMKLIEYYFLEIYGDAAPQHIEEVSTRLRELFNEYSREQTSCDHDSTLGDEVPRDKLKGFDKFLYQTSQSHIITSDLDKYLAEPVFPRNSDFSILNWWKVHTPRYPVLSMVAHDVLSIHVSTLEPEFTFTTTGRVLDPCYTSLNPDTREALLCGRDWLQREPEGQQNLSTSMLPVRMEMNC